MLGVLGSVVNLDVLGNATEKRCLYRLFRPFGMYHNSNWNFFFQEELKEVFEGSCQLIPIKIIREECITLSDEFVVELVETLASEMNPDTVCSVAGTYASSS